MATLRIGIDLISERGLPGGIHTYANRLLEALAERARRGEWDGELVVFHHDDFGWLFPAASHPAIRLVASGERRLGASRRRLRQQWLLPRAAEREGVHILHSVNNVLPFSARCPTVVTVHDLSPFELPERFHLLKRTYLRWAVPASIRKARRVLVPSRAVIGEIRRRFPRTPEDRLLHAPNAADERFHPRRDPARETFVRARHSLPESFLLSVAAAEPGKNHRRVAEALEILGRGQEEVPHWVIAGADERILGILGPRFLDGNLAPRIHLLGLVPAEDLPDLYRMARVFLFPSLYEGFGIPLLEALASGTPSLTSDRSSLPEVAGRAALQANPYRPESIARGIRELWRRPGLRDLLSRRGPEQAARFSWEATARTAVQAYEEALAIGGDGRMAPRPAEELSTG